MAASAAKKRLKELETKVPEWRKTLLGLYDQGASDREVMRELGLTPGAFEVLYNDMIESDFRELVDIGHVYAHAWWEGQGRKNLTTRGYNTSLWTINMKNRFGWSEKTEQSLTNIDVSDMDDEKLMRTIKDLNSRLGLRDS